MNLQSIVAHPHVRTARSLLQSRDRETLERQMELARIAAPSGAEQERGRHFAWCLTELGAGPVEIDEVGNVIARLFADGDPGAAAVVVAAHLDTIFPPETDTSVRQEGSRILGPGITDNARGLAGLLAIAGAFREAELRTCRPVVLIGTVGEEGLGDLRGVKHLFRTGSPFRRATAFISVDGAGANRIVNAAIGSRRLRATYTGLGGHSWGDRGLANPVHAMGRGIDRLCQLRPPLPGNWAVNVGRLGGGTSINAIPGDAWLELDLRCDRAVTLDWLETHAREALDSAVREEIETSPRGVPLRLDLEKIGDRPCGETPEGHELVQAALSVTRLLGEIPELTASSTDANVPISQGIPAIAIGAGGRAGGVHTTDEWFENHSGTLGLERVLLTVLAVAGLDGVDQDGLPSTTIAE